MKKVFHVDLEKQNLIFSAAHFITFGDDNICESLHGHNYRVRCKVSGSLNEHGYVTDFIALQNQLKSIVSQLDHKTLLAEQHPTIRVETNNNEVLASFENRRWIFPEDNCAVLPIANTTAELIAEWILDQLLVQNTIDLSNLVRIELAVDENEGQWGVAVKEF